MHPSLEKSNTLDLLFLWNIQHDVTINVTVQKNVAKKSIFRLSSHLNRRIFNSKYIRELQKATKAAKMSPNKRTERLKIRTCVVHIATLAVQVRSPYTSQFSRSYVTVCPS